MKTAGFTESFAPSAMTRTQLPEIYPRQPPRQLSPGQKDLKTWERLPDLKTKSQQRNVVLHPEFVNGKYALYTRPQDGFIDAGSGGGIGWALIDDITHAEVKEETIIDQRYYHTIKEVKMRRPPPDQNTERLVTSRPWRTGMRRRITLRALYVYDRVGRSHETYRHTRRLFHGSGNEERIGDVSNVFIL